MCVGNGCRSVKVCVDRLSLGGGSSTKMFHQTAAAAFRCCWIEGRCASSFPTLVSEKLRSCERPGEYPASSFQGDPPLSCPRCAFPTANPLQCEAPPLSLSQRRESRSVHHRHHRSNHQIKICLHEETSVSTSCCL